jgi:hypothetical protein
MAAGSESLRACQDGPPNGKSHSFHHAFEDPLMERIERIPVKNPEKASGQESGELLDFRAVIA